MLRNSFNLESVKFFKKSAVAIFQEFDFKSIPCRHLPAALSVIMILVNGILEASEIANLKVTN